MNVSLASALGLFAVSSVAMAAPIKMSDAEMDAVTAGQLIEVSRNNISVQVPVSANVQACVIVEQCRPTSENPVNANAQQRVPNLP